MLLTSYQQFALIFLAIFGNFAAAIAIFFALRSVRYARQSWKFAQSVAESKLDRPKIAEIDATLTELSDAYDALLKSHKKLRSRIGMRANREQASNGMDLSDERDKDKLRLQCRARGLLK